MDSADSAERESATTVLLYVGQPAHAEAPPVPSQRPSPGQVPPVVGAGSLSLGVEAVGSFAVVVLVVVVAAVVGSAGGGVLGGV